MKPDETKADTASKRLADSIRRANATEAASTASVGTISSAPALLKIEKALIASGANFLYGSRPTAEDAARFVEASALAATPGALEALPRTSSWLELVSLFPSSVRAAWAS